MKCGIVHAERISTPFVFQPISVLALLISGLSLLLFPLSIPAEAQQPKKIPRIGLLSNRVKPPANTPDFGETAFRNGLRNLGYIEGKNILIEYRYSDGKDDRLPALAAELLQAKVDVLFSASIRGIRAAKQATTSVPIVIVTTADPVEAGFVENLARGSGNVTGVTRFTRNLSGKRLELVKELLPELSRVGILINPNPSGISSDSSVKYYEAAATAAGIQPLWIEVRGSNPDLEGPFEAALKRRINAVLVSSGAVTISYRKKIAEVAIRHRIPSMCERFDFVEAGCLISYSADEAESYRRAAVYVDKILKGAEPADLPIEQPTKFELVINLKTAKQIGLTIPPNLLARADKVIR
jgi:putative ABC transport system substrate-binding protein